MRREPGNRGVAHLIAPIEPAIRRDMFAPAKFLRIIQMLGIPLVLLILSSTASTALAQIEPALPGYVEYTLTSNGQTWIETSDPITIGGYVEDLLTDRDNQPVGRGIIGIVTDINFDPDYGVDAATVDFGNDYLTGIVFPELTSVQIVPEPSGLVLLPGLLLWRAVLRRRPR
jgi:hypothetical protein